MRDLMIDLETLGLSSNSPVLSIGAVYFDTETGELGEKFYIVLDLDEQLKNGRPANGNTVKWWMTQSTEAKSVFSSEFSSVNKGLSKFVGWMNSVNPDPFVWGNGSIFDISTMENILTQYLYEVPWKFYKVMDLRTFGRFNSKGKPKVNKGTAHNALDDAIAQAQFVLDNYKKG